MVYAIAGGSIAYDPSLGGEPTIGFEPLDGNMDEVVVADLTPDGGGRIGKYSMNVGRPTLVNDAIPTKVRRAGPGIKRAKLLDLNRYTGSLGSGPINPLEAEMAA